MECAQGTQSFNQFAQDIQELATQGQFDQHTHTHNTHTHTHTHIYIYKSSIANIMHTLKQYKVSRKVRKKTSNKFNVSRFSLHQN